MELCNTALNLRERKRTPTIKLERLLREANNSGQCRVSAEVQVPRQSETRTQMLGQVKGFEKLRFCILFPLVEGRPSEKRTSFI